MTPTRRAEWLAAYNAAPPMPNWYQIEIETQRPPNRWVADEGGKEYASATEAGRECGEDFHNANKQLQDDWEKSRERTYAEAWRAFFADAALDAADERFPPPPWPEAGSSLPEGVGESVVKESMWPESWGQCALCDKELKIPDIHRLKECSKHFVCGECKKALDQEESDVRALVEAAREAESFLTHIGSITGERGEASCVYSLRTALAPFSEPAPKAKAQDPPYASCPWPGCTHKPRLHESGKWWECGSGMPHFLWTTTEPAPKAKLPEPDQFGQYQIGKEWILPSSDASRKGYYISNRPMLGGFTTAQAALDALVAEGLVKP